MSAIFRGKSGSANKANKLRINNEIKVKEVRLIDSAGEQLGLVGLADAIKKAEEAGLDLVEVAPLAAPPVCKILDYGKYQYEANKKAHQLKATQKAGALKEVKFRPFTDVNDRNIKNKKIISFLQNGHKVKVVISYRGRERAYQRKGLVMLKEIFTDLEEFAIYDMMPKSEGSTIVMILSPKSSK